jgi:hypothetical protein
MAGVMATVMYRLLSFAVLISGLEGVILRTNGVFSAVRSAIGRRDFATDPQTSFEYLISRDNNKLVIRSPNGTELGLSCSSKGLSVQLASRRNPVVSSRMQNVCHGIYGLYELPAGIHVAVIKDSKPCSGSGSGLRRVTKFDLIRIPGTMPVLSTNATAVREEQEAAEIVLNNALRQHDFYISTDRRCDITRTCQSNALEGIAPPDERFFWNLNCVRPLVENNCSAFVVPVMSGWLSTTNMTYRGTKYLYTLISRRGRRRQGPR